MLDDYKDKQPIIYKTLINSNNKDKLSHAYLIESNNSVYAYDFSLALTKLILCPNKYSNNNNCKNCNQCLEIDNNEYIELKIIEAEGQWIKKNQLEELQKEFSKKSVLGNNKVYIIKDAEKLNESSSNSLLKFLEEPSDGVVAILICSNQERIISTIRSRCQILSLKEEKKVGVSTFDKINDFSKNNDFSKEFLENSINAIVNFIEYYEKNKIDIICYTNDLFFNYFKEKNEIYFAFQLMILFYKDVLNILINKKIEYFNDYIDRVNLIKENNNINSIIFKINIISQLQAFIKNNVNSNILLDKLIIELERSNKVD